MNNYRSNPDILRPGVVSTITKRIYTVEDKQHKTVDKDTGK